MPKSPHLADLNILASTVRVYGGNTQHCDGVATLEEFLMANEPDFMSAVETLTMLQSLLRTGQYIYGKDAGGIWRIEIQEYADFGGPTPC